ncbi:MAG: hypothetical protein A2W30_10355 [Ignavibacteria bacterium RBG_16_36_9]|nr:MAG: hypothetical protein A2W30_10355 [Ignavibacteria bacterium RBG_16_36_9]
MISFWKKIPEQVKRLSLILIIFIITFIFIRSKLVPPDFGEYGHYRTSAVDEIIGQEIKYAGHTLCNDCHNDVVDFKKTGYHRNVACEVCHGPAALHTDDPVEFELQSPRERGHCPLCHEYISSRPTGFPQIVSASHNPMKPCISCHNPHDPKPPEAPKECEACHAEISRTKSLSHHVYIECTVCHQTPNEHKINPRNYLPGIPSSREFCGGCHSKDSTASDEIPKIDINSHGERYMCWQCHYPHLPEAR